MPRNNPIFRGILTCLFLVVSHWQPAIADDAVVSSFPKNRYASLHDHSPFAVATAAAPVAPQASFASNWYVTGVARVDDNYYVTIKGRDLATQFTLFGNEMVDGVSLASVSWSDQVGKSTVILRKGTETARLEFNEAQLRASSSATVGASPAPGAKAAGVAAAAGPQPLGVNMAAAVPNGAGLNGGIALKRRSLPIPVPR